MGADIDEIGRRHPGRRGIGVIGDAERGIVIPQDLEDSLFVPAWVSELEGAAMLDGDPVEASGETFPRLAIGLEGRGKLKQDRSECLGQTRHPPEHEADAVLDVLQPLHMGDEA